MKNTIIKIHTALILLVGVNLIFGSSLQAQAPEKVSYQAVVRDAYDELVVNDNIGVQISVIQGSASGTPVYVETQMATTNQNGLISLEIGDGNVVTGSFSGIDWADGQYFIKTEFDISGGTNYSLSGTSALLSVPYALHSKSSERALIADSISGGMTINETDPVFNSSTAAGISTSDTAYWNNKLDMLIAGTGISISGDTISTSGSGGGSSSHNIGDYYGGGIIFWLDPSGEHGLIADTIAQAMGATWYNGTNTTTNAVRDGIGAGMYNTERIIINQGPGTYAAQLCANYQGGGYGDWYLPSKYELNLMYVQRSVIGGFTVNNPSYWSSTEGDNGNAWLQNSQGAQHNYFKNTNTWVRAIRAF